MTNSPQAWPEHFPYAHWYLDAVSGSLGWTHVEAKDRNGNQTGILPFQLRRRFGLRILTAPPLAPRLGPHLWMPENVQTERERLSFYHEMLGQLDKALPPADFYRISWPYELTYGLPWQQRGWQQRVRYSYVLPLVPAIETIWQGIRPTRRHEIRKAEKRLRVESSDNWRLLFDLIEEVFLFRNVNRQLSVETIQNLHQAARQQDACQLWIASDEQNNPHAALWLYHDTQRSYSLFLGSDPAMRQSGAVGLLLWHAIQWSKTRGLNHFDFEGSHLLGVEPFFRSFGAEAWPYYEFVKGKKWLLALRQLRGRL